jgi:hypothetical protein
MEKKHCGAGDHSVSIDRFWKRKGKLQPNCIECQSSINKQRYALNSKSHIKSVSANNARKRKAFIVWKQTLSCCFCEETFHKCLDFHHVNAKKKDFALSGSLNNMGLETVMSELKKCVVVCKNCHTKVHENLLKLPTPIPLCNPASLKELINGTVV